MLPGLFHIGAAVLKTSIDSVKNTLLAQIGSVVESYVYSDRAEIWQSWGFSSRPSPPTAGKDAAECIAIRGDRDRIIAGRDVRGQAIYGNLKDGETCVYATGADGNAQGRLIVKQDGSATLFTTDSNDSTGNSVYFRVAPDGFTWVAPWGTMRFDATGFHVLHASGARLDLGGMGGLRAPLDSLGSYAGMTAAMVNMDGSIFALGGPDGMPAARAQPLVAFMGEVAAALTACAAATTGPGAPAAVATAATVASSVTGLAAATTSGVSV